MPFLILSNADIQFAEKELTQRFYTVAEILPTIKWVELIDKKKFVKAVPNEESKTFVVYVAALEPRLQLAEFMIQPAQAAQIAALKQDEAPIKVPPKYADYTDVFSLDLAMELPENTSINKHTIELEVGKQPPYGPIYSLELVELKTLKTYIKTNLKSGFI